MSASMVVGLDGRRHSADERVDDDGVVETEVGGIAADRLRSIVERVERLTEEKKALASDIKDIMAEAKSAGFVVRVVQRIIKIRAMKPEDVKEEDDLLPLYRRAMGME